MPRDRMSALDASFLEVESPSAHMHVGWAALFAPPSDGRLPRFEDLVGHIESRLPLAPRYRQRVAEDALGLSTPVWVDDPAFDVRHHVRRARSPDFGGLVDEILSTPLRHDRPLWELWVADGLEDGRLGIVGKAHHCMVDGVAAVELMGLLLDATPDPPAPPVDGWRPAPDPSPIGLAAAALRERMWAVATLWSMPLRVLSRPSRVLGLPGRALGAVRALARSATPAPAPTLLNRPLSTERHLARFERPLEDLRRVRARFGATVNDVMLAASAGGVRSLLEGRAERAFRPKAMVPVNVRGNGGEADLGNRISFLFVDLPCDEPDPVRRMERVQSSMGRRKSGGEGEGADGLLRALEYAPRTVQRAASHLVASPRTYNLTVSNIPGPRMPLYMLGCELESAHPVVPLPEGHGVSIGMTTVKDTACFGVYGDPAALPDVDVIARGIQDSIDELLV